MRLPAREKTPSTACRRAPCDRRDREGRRASHGAGSRLGAGERTAAHRRDRAGLCRQAGWNLDWSRPTTAPASRSMRLCASNRKRLGSWERTRSNSRRLSRRSGMTGPDDAAQSVRADRVLATGEQLSRKALQTNFPRADVALSPGSAAAAVEPGSIKSEALVSAITRRQTSTQQHDYGNRTLI